MLRKIFTKIFPKIEKSNKKKFSYFDRGKKIKKINL